MTCGRRSPLAAEFVVVGWAILSLHSETDDEQLHCAAGRLGRQAVAAAPA